MRKEARITAICNQKGGVGKTVTAVNLGIGLAREGKRVLLVDVDAQGSLTASLGYKRPDQMEDTLAVILGHIIADEPLSPGEGIIHHGEGVDLLPANIELSGLEVTLVNTMSRETILRDYLNSVRDQYDVILLDCCPSLGMLTINALAAADEVLIPMQAHYLSIKGLEQLKVSGEILSAKTDIRKSERRIKAIDTTLSHLANHGAYKEVYKKYASIGWKTRKEKFAAEHREELDAYLAANRFFKAHHDELPYDKRKLNEERKQLSGELSEKNEGLQVVQEDMKLLRDVRNWINHVLPPEQRRAVAEPGKKPSINEQLSWKIEGVKQREERKRQQPRRQQKQDKTPASNGKGFDTRSKRHY